MAGNIILDGRLIKAYDRLKALAEYAGKTKDYADELWNELLLDDRMMDEFMYYLDNHTFLDKLKCSGYGLTDLYFFNMRNVEMKQDVGKNYADTNKEGLALDTFLMMADMLRNLEVYIKRLEAGPGMDRFYD
ncbi:MAG: hypothetical protein IJJ74_01055 [Eubacterium sp.]|nr:hypothetical protein [Eubacterium sp.]